MIDLQLFTFKNGIATYNSEELVQRKSSQGYIYVQIEGKNRRLHRLIGLKYISNPLNLPCIDHVDNDKTNNAMSNLQWISYSNNSSKAYQENPNMSIFHQGAVSIMAKKGLYANIHAKRKRIKAGSKEKMRKPGTKGAPTKANFKRAKKTAKKR